VFFPPVSLLTLSNSYFEGNPEYSTVFGVSQINIPGAVNGTYPNSTVLILRNYCDQNKTILAPTDARDANKVSLVTYWIRALPANTTFCMVNNTARVWCTNATNTTSSVCYGLPIGARFSDFDEAILASCPLLPPGDQVWFPDNRRFLRVIAYAFQCNISDELFNEERQPDTVRPPALPPGLYGIKGTFQDIQEAFADAHLELYQGTLYCSNCCLPIPPPVCYVSPPGVDSLISPGSPWFGQFVFNSIVECVNHCNATAARTCQLLGQSDPMGTFLYYGVPVPFRVFNEAIDVSIGPNVNGNQSSTVTIIGEPGMAVCAPTPNRINNPAGSPFLVVVEGVTFWHCDGSAAATWDYSDGADNTSGITLFGNVFYGNSTTARPIDGIFDSNFTFSGNYLTNFTGDYGARFIGRICNESIVVTLNTFYAFHGVNLEILGFDNIVCGDSKPNGNDNYNNLFIDAGGSLTVPVDQRYVLRVSTCDDGLPGTITIIGNNVIATPGQVCVPPLWSGFYIDPMPWYIVSPFTNPQPTDLKQFNIQFDYADDNNCIAMRLANTTFECFSPDQQGFLREEIWYKHNQGLIGSQPPYGFGLYIGGYDAAQETKVLQFPNMTDTICYHCELGCPTSPWSLFAWIVGGTILGILLLICICCFFCPGCCICWPVAPTSWHEDPVLGKSVPDDPSMWLYFVRYGPTVNGGQPWPGEQGQGQMPPNQLRENTARSLDEANARNLYTGWGGALNEATNYKQ
jgi:hypothetical protein